MSIVLDSALLFPNCSRSSDFKSTPKQVHLLIYHALDALNYLINPYRLASFCRIASVFKNSPLIPIAKYAYSFVKPGTEP